MNTAAETSIYFATADSFSYFAVTPGMRTFTARILYICLLLAAYRGVAQPLAGQALIDSLKKRLATQPVDTVKASILSDLSFHYYPIDPDSGLYYGLQSLSLAEKLDWDRGRANACRNIGTNYLSETEFARALDYYFRAAVIDSIIGDRAGLASVTGNIGNVYQNLCDYPKALQYYFRALRMCEVTGNMKALAGNQNNIGLVYQAQNNPDLALDHYKQALRIFDSIHFAAGIASATGNIGIVYYDKHEYGKALEYEFKQLSMERSLGDKGVVANVEGFIGSSYAQIKDFARAIAYEQDALKLAGEMGDKHLAATQLEYLGFAYLSLITDTAVNYPAFDSAYGDIVPATSIPAAKNQRLGKAFGYLKQCLATSEEIGTPDVAKDCYQDLSTAYKLLGDYKKSLECFENYAAIKDSLFSKENKENLLKIAANYEQDRHTAETIRQKLENAAKQKEQQQLLYRFIIGFLVVLLTAVVMVYRLRGDLTHIATNVQDSPDAVVRKMSLVIISIATCFAALVWAWLYYYNIGWKPPTYCPIVYFAIVAPSVAIFFVFKKEQLLVNVQLFCIFFMPLVMEWTGGGFSSGVVIDWSILAPIGALMYKGLRAAVWWMTLFVAAVIATIIFNDYFSVFNTGISQSGQSLFYGMNIIGPAIVIYFSMQFFVRSMIRDGIMLQDSNKHLSDTLGELQLEKQKSDNLLLNILPEQIAEELKQKSQSDARLYDHVTVLLTDFKNFTGFSERHTPQEIVSELHQCFKAFDEIMARHHVEKIKTIGDGYLAVCGLPLADPDHALNAIGAAKEIIAFMDQRYAELGERTFRVRIGVHSGDVVAGIVGVKKFAYDIWGDTVNIAARMEQNSEPGKINISQTTYLLVRDKVTCVYRGEIDAKNKGRMNMYFVDTSQ